MGERNANDSMERIDEDSSRSGGESANNPPADPKDRDRKGASAPKGTDERPPRTRSTTETDSSNP